MALETSACESCGQQEIEEYLSDNHWWWQYEDMKIDDDDDNTEEN